MKPARPNPLELLSGKLSSSLSRFNRDSEDIMLAIEHPFLLKQEADRIALLFEQGAPPEPPLQQRINALARLRRGEADLSRREWTLITWGLCDDCGTSGKPIAEQPLFDAVMAHTGEWIIRRDVPRKGWFGLLNSYFSFDIDAFPQHGNWRRLRVCLLDTMPILFSSLSRPKMWSRMIEQHADIFTDQPGYSLRHILFYGSVDEREQLRNSLPIPESSWLWRRVITYQIDYLNSMSDKDFVAAIPRMVDFIRTRPLYADELLAAMLTRYCQSPYRPESHEILKTESFARWGNPQLRSSARWSLVQEPVRGMVLRWFAKEDLEHFFSLLQGSGQVDKARLVYWLRFVDQISYTRILLGEDALTNQDPEFRNFRQKNASRYGSLNGGLRHNNGFVLRIGEHYLVEFSGTGNACYAYQEKELPFDPSAKTLHADHELKRKIYDRQGVDNRILHNSGWESKADQFLAKRGIRAGAVVSATPDKVRNYHARFSSRTGPVPLQSPMQTTQITPKTADPGKKMPPVLGTSEFGRRVISQAKELARINKVEIQDNLEKGGAFWVLASNPDTVLGRELARLGMTHHPEKGYWIK